MLMLTQAGAARLGHARRFPLLSLLLFRTYATLVLLLLWVMASSQENRRYQPVVTTTQPTVQGLQYADPGQEATWTFDAATAYPVSPNPEPTQTQWSINGSVIETIPYGQSFTYTFTSAGLYQVSAMWMSETGSIDVAAIAGPLSLGWIAGSSGNTPHHDDNLPTNPVYIQYFYSANHTMAQYDEVEQWGSVTAAEAQPPGVTVSYSVPGNVVAQSSVTNISPSTTVDLKPNATGLGAVTATFTMNYTVPGTTQVLSGSAQDDTEASGLPYQFDGHYPGSMFLVTGDPDYPVNPQPYYTPQGTHAPPDPNGCWGGGLYLYGLLDSSGERMPGVWVNEHFGPGTPPGLGVNQAGNGWETIWGTVAFDTGGATWGAAYFDAYDQITCSWTMATYPWTNQSWQFMHYYDGGTMAIDGSGVLVGTYTTTMEPGGQKNSPPATVGQQ